MTAAGAILLLLAAEPRWGLTFKSADGCITAADLAEAIEKRLGHPTFGAKPDVRIDGYLKADGPRRWRARLTLVGADGTVQGSREVTQEGSSCRAIDESLTLVAAVMIDPASALKGAAPAVPPPSPQSELAPPPTQVEPPPPPSSSPPPPPRLIVPRIPPRDEWPGYVLVEAGNFTQDGRWMSRGTFYRIVGRPDLDQAYTRRITTKALSYVVGSVALTAGAILMLLQSSNVSCVRYGGSPASPGACLEKSTWPLVAGGVTLGAGLVAVLFASIFSTVPTSAKEDQDLAETYNSKLKPPSLPVTASLW
jgi:hypothetical protein